MIFNYHMIKKEFHPNLYDITDDKAKQAVSNYLISTFKFKIDSTETYDVDIVAQSSKNDKLISYHEVEIKLIWKNEMWPFEKWHDVHIPYRKKKILENNIPSFIYFWILRSDCTLAMITRGDNLKDEYVTEVPNKYIEEGEQFYCIPLKHFKEIRLI